MKITLLGTGSPIPDSYRAGPATLVRAGDATLLVDAGRGVLMRLDRGRRRARRSSTAVLLTHLHSDHITDLNDVITTHWVMCPQPTTLARLGPPGTQAVVDGMLAMLGPDIGYRLAHHADLTWAPQVEVTEVAPGDSFDDRRRRCARRRHRPPAGRADASASASSTTAGGGARRRRRAVRRARRAVPPAPTSTCRPCSATTSCAGPDRRASRTPRLPLDGRAGRADREPRRRRHARPHPLRAAADAGRRGRVAGARRRALRRPDRARRRPHHRRAVALRHAARADDQ